MRRYSITYFFLLLFHILSSPVIAQEDESVWNIPIDSITVLGYHNRLPIKIDSDGAIIWNMAGINKMPQMLGNADPIRYAQLLPGIQTNNEYRSGVNVEGCDSQHNVITLNGVPIYNASHLLGFFSSFNYTHFSDMRISRGITSAGSKNRLGGQMDLHSIIDLPDSINGEFSLGLISSQGTIKIPMGRKNALTVSIRGSYMNFLYSSWMKAENNKIKYFFYDTNFTLINRPNKKHLILVDFYRGADHARYTEGHYLANLEDKWGNILGAIHWIYETNNKSSHSKAYITSYKNRFGLNMQELSLCLPSGITDIGIENELKWRKLSIGFEAIWHSIRPQSLEHKGSFLFVDDEESSIRSLETSLYGNYKYHLLNNVSISTGLRGSLFLQGERVYCRIDPSIRFSYDNPSLLLYATYAMRHQYINQTGFSNLGLPTEYWTSVNEEQKPQYIHEFSISCISYMLKHKYKVSVNLFYKLLFNQLGYNGSVLDFVNNININNNFLTNGKGKNYGFNIMINKCFGSITGWLSYTYTHAMRSFKQTGYLEYYPASHERPHELNGVATYTLNKHWNFGGAFVLASGTPYTPAQSLLIINNNIIIKYGSYNSARLHPYMRLDLSANYKWKNNVNREQGVNLSFYNVTCRRNELFYYLHIRKSIEYRPVSFVLRILPSISYYIKF